jgi:hypothetical protein
VLSGCHRQSRDPVRHAGEELPRQIAFRQHQPVVPRMPNAGTLKPQHCCYQGQSAACLLVVAEEKVGAAEFWSEHSRSMGTRKGILTDQKRVECQ